MSACSNPRPRRFPFRKGVLPVLLGALLLLGGVRAPRSEEAVRPTSATANGRKAELGFSDNEASRSRVRKMPTVAVECVRGNDTLRLTGTLIADDTSEVACNVSGIVQEVKIERGSMVEKGDVLAQLDPTDARNALAEGEAQIEELRVRLGMDQKGGEYKPEELPEVKVADAALALARANHQRTRELLEKGVASKSQDDQTQAEYDSALQRRQLALHQGRQLFQSYQTALIRLTILRKALQDTTVLAPFSGWIVEKFVAPGEHVVSGPGGGDKIATLVRMDPLRLALTIPQQSSGRVRLGQEVQFQVDSIPGRVFAAKVRHIAPAVASDTRSLTVEAVVANADRVLRPGLFATADLQLPGEKTEYFLPAAAVRREGDVGRVFVVENGQVRERVVSALEAAGGRIQILSGLTGQETVAADARTASDGERVN